jgi:hypothetical protein
MLTRYENEERINDRGRGWDRDREREREEDRGRFENRGPEYSRESYQGGYGGEGGFGNRSERESFGGRPYSESNREWGSPSSRGPWGQGNYANQGRYEGQGSYSGPQTGYGSSQGGFGPDYGRGYEYGGSQGNAGQGFGSGSWGTQNYGMHDYNREQFGRGNYPSGRSFRGGPGEFGMSSGEGSQQRYGTQIQNRPSEQTGSSAGQYSGYASGFGNFTGGMGDYYQGRHTGRGPKSYKRSDERIREDINERLTQHGEIDAWEIEVQVHNGEVTLMGIVDERRIKRMAEDVAESVSGVKELHNQLRTRPQSEQRSGTSESSGGHQQTSAATASSNKK